LLGLAVIFSCLMLSYAYIKKELSYDKFHSNADRIVRYSLQYENESIDVRIPGFTGDDPSIADVSGIEAIVRMRKVNGCELKQKDRNHLLEDLYLVSSNFFDVFDFKLLEGDRNRVLDAPEKAVISKSYARQLFGEESPMGKEIQLVNDLRFGDKKVLYVSGVFEDFPETSHFHSDILVHLPDAENDFFTYVYLLLYPQTNVAELTRAIATNLDEVNKDDPRKASPYLFPLTDIHLHSHLQREHEPNGHIYYVYLITGANLLLLLIVLFNLWLNAGLIFSFNRRYYQLLRLNGASSLVVLRDESLLALILGCISMVIGAGLAWLVSPGLQWEILSDGKALFLLCLSFLFLVVMVSAVPVFNRMSSTLFLNTQTNLRNSGFTLSNVKYMLIGQYGIVMFIIIVSFCITKQIGLIRASQVGGEERTILVLNEQPSAVQERYELLKAELTKYPEIRMVTSAMQLPGSAIRDRIGAWKEGESPEDYKVIPLLVVGNDFLPFFNIQPVAGRVFQQNKISLKEEQQLLNRFFTEKERANVSEEYVLNQKAIQLLGFDSPEEAIGKRLYFSQGTIDYINNGTIVGVTENFNYTNTYEDSIPQILLQRTIFQSCFMIYLSPEKTEQAIQTFNHVWNEINPEYEAQYTFLHDVYNDVYRNELNAEQLVRVFSLLCLIVATLGLIIIMAFVIKRKTKEIGIRKVNGATTSDIIQLLNSRFVRWIFIAFLLAVPGAYVVMVHWLESFAYKTSLDWWIFALAGISVLLLSVAAISWQSWRAATIDPVKTLKSE
jgi:putative ABC transport system permease protein